MIATPWRLRSSGCAAALAASAYAGRHHAGTPRDQIGRYRLLADKGIQTVFVSFPDLAGPDEVHRFAPIAAAFA